MKLHITALLTAAILVGCGGGGSSSSSSSSAAASVGSDAGDSVASLSGATADGYLVGANVCLDTDGDSSCNGEDTIVVTGDNGVFSIEATDEELSEYPLLTEVVEGVTTDSDRITASNPTGVIGTGEGFVLSSPPNLLNSDGTAFISPITTLVENLRASGIADNKTDEEALADAQAQILALLGSDIGLTEDYVAASLSGDSASMAAAERIHVIARVATALFAELKREAEAAPTNILLTDAFSVGIKAIVQQVGDIVETVEASLVIVNATNFSSDAERLAAIAAAVADTAGQIEVPNRDQLAGLIEIDKISRVPLTAAQMLTVDGGVWIGEVDADIEEVSETSTEVNETFTVYFENIGIYERGETSTESGETSTESGETSTESSETSTILESDETSSQTFIDEYFLSPLYGLIFEEEYDRPVLTGNGWTEPSGPTTFVVEDDGSVTCDGNLGCTIDNVVSFDLEDKDIADTMALFSEDGALWRKILIDQMSFGVGATGYIANINTPESYEIDGPVFNPFFDYFSLSDLIEDSNALTAAVDIFTIKTIQVGDFGSGVFVAMALGDDGVAYLYSGNDFNALERVGSVAYRSFNLNGEAFIEIPSVELSLGTTDTVLLTGFDGSVNTVDYEEAESGGVLLLDAETNQALIDAIDSDKIVDPYYYY